MTTSFTVILRVLDASAAAQRRNNFLFVDDCASHPQDTSFLQNVIFVCYASDFKSMMPSIRTTYGYTLRRISASILMHV